MMEEEEILPSQEEDDGLSEDRDSLMAQLQQLAQAGPAAALLQAGKGWLEGRLGGEEVARRAAELEGTLEEDPLLSSQFERLEEGLRDGQQDQVLYALLGLGCELNPS